MKPLHSPTNCSISYQIELQEASRLIPISSKSNSDLLLGGRGTFKSTCKSGLMNIIDIKIQQNASNPKKNLNRVN